MFCDWVLELPRYLLYSCNERCSLIGIDQSCWCQSTVLDSIFFSHCWQLMTPPEAKKFFNFRYPPVGAERVFYGRANDPQIAPSLTHGIRSKISIPVTSFLFFLVCYSLPRWKMHKWSAGEIIASNLLPALNEKNPSSSRQDSECGKVNGVSPRLRMSPWTMIQAEPHFIFPRSKGVGFLDSSAGKESACNAGGPGSIPGSGRSPSEQFLGREAPLEKG